MINVNQITAQLARLPDAALQQYAAMHKNDPYTMALASAESNRRKQMRSGAQGAAQPQPTVADQEISSMHAAPQPQAASVQGQLPEEQGIGTLPTPNMQGMADGGIVGYADGGIPENTFLTEERMAAADRAMAAARARSQGAPKGYYNPATQALLHPFGGDSADDGATSTFGQFLSGIPAFLSGGPEAQAKRDKQNKELELQRQMLNADPGLFEKLTPAQRAERLQQLNALQSQMEQQQKTPAVVPAQGQSFPPSVVPQAAPGATPAAVPPAVFKDARAAATATTAPTAKTKPAKTAAAPSAPTAKPEGLESLYKRVSELGGDKETKDNLQKYQNDVDASIEALKIAREGGKPAGEAYAAYKESLDRDAAAAKGKEDQNFKMAIINAGLAIAGGKSQYALQNIAEGAQVGTKQYQAGLDKLEEAAKARQKEMAMIEQARHAEARGDWKDKNEFEQNAANAKLSAKKFGVEGLASLTGANKKDAITLFDKQAELALQEKIHRESMANQLKIAELYASARTAAAGTKGEITPAIAFKNYTIEKANAEKMGQGDQFNLKYPTKEAYIAEAMQAATPGAAGAAAPVDTTGFKVLR